LHVGEFLQAQLHVSSSHFCGAVQAKVIERVELKYKKINDFAGGKLLDDKNKFSIKIFCPSRHFELYLQNPYELLVKNGLELLILWSVFHKFNK
jgi:hypothetical protein